MHASSVSNIYVSGNAYPNTLIAKPREASIVMAKYGNTVFKSVVFVRTNVCCLVEDCQLVKDISTAALVTPPGYGFLVTAGLDETISDSSYGTVLSDPVSDPVCVHIHCFGVMSRVLSNR